MKMRTKNNTSGQWVEKNCYREKLTPEIFLLIYCFIKRTYGFNKRIMPSGLHGFGISSLHTHSVSETISEAKLLLSLVNFLKSLIHICTDLPLFVTVRLKTIDSHVTNQSKVRKTKTKADAEVAYIGAIINYQILFQAIPMT